MRNILSPFILHFNFGNFRNGPAKFEVGVDKIQHPYDGDGMISAITFANSQACFRNRFIITKVLSLLLSYFDSLIRNVIALKGLPDGKENKKSELQRNVCNENERRKTCKYSQSYSEEHSKYEYYLLGGKASCVVGGWTASSS